MHSNAEWPKRREELSTQNEIHIAIAFQTPIGSDADKLAG